VADPRGALLSRSEAFIVSKTGPGGLCWPLGYNETLQQAAAIAANYSTTYVDLLLLHWPVNFGPCKYHGPPATSSIPTTDPLCDLALPTYDEAGCRLSSWRGALEARRRGLAKAVGVSNFNSTHLRDIAAAGLELPSVNQCNFSPLHNLAAKPCTPNSGEGETCADLIAHCSANGIVFNGYSPFGGAGQAGTLLKDQRIAAIARAHNAT